MRIFKFRREVRESLKKLQKLERLESLVENLDRIEGKIDAISERLRLSNKREKYADRLGLALEANVRNMEE